MMTMNSNGSLEQLLQDLNLTPAAEKTAAAATGEDNIKLAEEIESAGRLMADAFYDRVQEKQAADRASSSHSAAGDGGMTDGSVWSRIKESIQKARGHRGAGINDSGHIRAEDAFKHRMVANPGKGREGY